MKQRLKTMKWADEGSSGKWKKTMSEQQYKYQTGTELKAQSIM